MFRRVLIANRGEIAVRIIRTLKALKVGSVAVYAADDKDLPHVRLADARVALGPGPPAKTYLNGDALVEAALAAECDAVHPGYGFLSENPDFALLCAREGLTFIGPPPSALTALGDKDKALDIARAVGVPTTPGSDGVLADADHAREIADSIGYPVLLKAARGGGGMGMQLVRTADELRGAWAVATAQAGRAFGHAALILEKYWERARHVEVQVAGDRSGTLVHLGERECSIQRRHQKLLEEAPSPAVSPELRRRLGEAALAVCGKAGVTCLATAEFLVHERGFSFNEVNPRLQVEHTVTEEVTGLDLVELQIRLAAGEPALPAQHEVVLRGWAVEARVNAEDPLNGFAPSPGRVDTLHLPRGEGMRVDTMLAPGLLVPSSYDSLVAKVIVRSRDRAGALAGLSRALDGLHIEGFPTTAPFLAYLARHPKVRAGDMTTRFLDEHRAVDTFLQHHAAEAAAVLALLRPPEVSEGTVRLRGHVQAFRAEGGRVTIADRTFMPVATQEGDAWTIRVGDALFRLERSGHDLLRDGVTLDAQVRGALPERSASVTGKAATVRVSPPMPGTILRVLVRRGDTVRRGQALLVLEAMKMQNEVVAPADGRVVELRVQEGATVGKDDVLVTIEPA